MVVPTMLARHRRSSRQSAAQRATLRPRCPTAARACRRRCSRRALRVLPDVGFVNAYGLTETSSTIALLGPDDHREAIAAERSGRAGAAGHRSAARARRGGRRSADERGDVRAGAVRRALGARRAGVRRVPRTGIRARRRGWFPTRDRAWLDADGYLFIEGRADDTIIRGGENISPAEIEDVLVNIPASRTSRCRHAGRRVGHAGSRRRRPPSRLRASPAHGSGTTPGPGSAAHAPRMRSSASPRCRTPDRQAAPPGPGQRCARHDPDQRVR